MTIQTDAVVAVKEGVVFNCDGNAYSDVKTVSAAASGANHATLSTVTKVSEQNPHASAGGAMKLKRAFAEPAKANIKVYASLPLPAAVQA
jgi:hypothetical protein